MSLWFRKRDSEGKDSLFSVGLPLGVLVFAFSFAVAYLVIEIVQMPRLGLWLSVVVLLAGAALRIASAAVFRAEQARGAVGKSRRLRLAAHISYALMICGTLTMLVALSQVVHRQ